jgi:N-acetyl-gamma-glutamyl-phosphate reductase
MSDTDGQIRAAIVGGTGYGGMELLRLLLAHPSIEVATITSRTCTDAVADVHPHLRGFTDLCFTDAGEEELATEHELVFFAAPHGVAAAQVPDVLQGGDAKVVDLSGDFRLGSAEEYRRHYGADHPRPDVLGSSVYGLAECGRRDEIAAARLVANPGCHATAVVLGLWPLLSAGLVGGRVAVTSVTGSSGSGGRAGSGTHHPERFANFKAYRPLAHQHHPEIVAALRGDVAVDFVPHSGPFARGIHVTAFVPLAEGDADDVTAAFAEAYGDEPFVRLVEGAPEVRAVAGGPMADIGVTTADGLAVVMVAIDNLMKGMASQAVQNANLLFGLDETAGLMHPGVGP